VKLDASPWRSCVLLLHVGVADFISSHCGASRVIHESIQELTKKFNLANIQTSNDLGVASLDDHHEAAPDAIALGGEGQHNASAVRAAGRLGYQALFDQRLCGSTGLTFVQVRSVCQVVDR
jgi:hypothetical protein